METLKTQFTPGQPMSPSLSSAIEESRTGLQLSQENDNLKAEIRDLNEKLETLKGSSHLPMSRELQTIIIFL